MQENIIAFPGIARPRQASDTPDITGSNTPAKVHTLLTKPQFHVYNERFGQKRELFEPFFATLISTGKVMMIEKGKDIRNAILRVASTHAWVYDITVSDFLNMTESVIGMTGELDVMWYITSNLDGLGIDIGYKSDEDEDFVEETMDEEGLFLFRPEEIQLTWELSPQEDGFYGLFLKITEDVGLFHSPDEFLKPEDISLLHLLSISRRDYIYNEIDMKGDFTLELSMYEGNTTLTTYIPFSYLDRILDAAILRKYPLYANFSSPEKRMDKFYTDVVFPLSNPEDIEGEE